MRLLHTTTRRFHEINAYQNPARRYAILSHRWIEDEEVSYQEFLLITAGDDLHQNSTVPHRRSTLNQKSNGAGFQKIDKACQRALQDGYDFIWIDTCCIDKTSSAELSEAVNSMWKWYYNSSVCYAYLADVGISGASSVHPSAEDFAHSQWFSRAWTLQELLAPDAVLFYDKDWKFMFEKSAASVRIFEITGIDSRVIADRRAINAHSINTKMTWAANRKATRIEDLAYSLFGLFRVNMSLLYGEGSNAFLRLQKEILAQSDDESIFAHTHKFDLYHSPLAVSPSDFVVEDEVLGRRELRCFEHTQLGSHPFTVTNKGIQWRAAFVREALNLGYFVIALNCRYKMQRIPVLLSLWRPSGLFGENDSNYIVLPNSQRPSWLPDNIQDATIAMRMLESFVDNKESYDPFEYHTITLSWLRTVLVRAPSGSETFDHYQMQNQAWNTARIPSRVIASPSPALLERFTGTQANIEGALSLIDRNISRSHEPSNEHIRLDSMALATVLDRMLSNVLISHGSSNTTLEDIVHSLATFLGVSDQLEEMELKPQLESLVPGTCKWLLGKPEFLAWHSDDSSRTGASLEIMSATQAPPGYGATRIFWLTGLPGSGKSMIAAQLVEHLLEQRRKCQFYFFKLSNKLKQDISAFLKSIAIQMAIHNDIVRQTLWQMREEGTMSAKSTDYRAVWRQIFEQRILRTSFYQQQYWIIDGLDEAIDGHDLITLLAKIPDNLPIKIFITSRMGLHLERALSRLTIIHMEIEAQDSLKDLRMLLEAEMSQLPGDDQFKSTLVEEILQKSQGHFLWTKLVLAEIMNAHTEEDLRKIISAVPQGMHDLYVRIIHTMERHRGSTRELIKSILRWVICGQRPLSTSELGAALKLDIASTLVDVRNTVANVCGELVIVDAQDNVQIIHNTLREFLLSSELASEYAVDAAATHAHLAAICLEQLATYSPRLQSARRSDPQNAIQDYANLYFSHHLDRCSVPLSEALFAILVRFLQKGILFWIEYIAGKIKDLSHLVRAASVLNRYVRRYLQQCPPLDPRIAMTEKWSTDLIRLTTAFGSELLANPLAIHRTIPALCPSTSMLYKQFGGSLPHVKVAGSSYQDWPERIYSASYLDSGASAIACSEAHHAVGLRNGLVMIYDALTWLERCRFSHGEQVRCLRFVPERQWLLVSGTSSLSTWHYGTTEILWRLELSSEPLALHWTEDNMIRTVNRSGETILYDATTGKVFDKRSLKVPDAPSLQQIVIFEQLESAALIYRDWVLILHDLTSLDDESVSYNRMERVIAVAFNETLELLAISTRNGDIFTMDVWSLEKVSSVYADSASALLDVSPDGTMLLAGFDNGCIQIYDFESLHCLCYVDTSEGRLTSLMFAANGLRILSVKEGQFNVWEPAELIRGHDENVASGSNIAVHPPDRVGTPATPIDENLITAIAIHHSGHSVLCARADGTVAVYSAKDSALLQELFACKSTIRVLEWHSEQGLITVADDSGRLSFYRTDVVRDHESNDLRQIWTARSVFQETLSEPVCQVLLTKDGNFAFVSTTTCDYLWKIDNEGEDSYMETHRKNYLTTAVLVAHPPRQFFKLDRTEVWRTRGSDGEGVEPELECVTVERTRCFRCEAEFLGPDLREIAIASSIVPYYGSAISTIWTGRPSFSTLKDDATTLITFQDLQPHVREILGKYYLRLVFIDTDDWICTMMPNAPDEKIEIQRHLPVPRMWRAPGLKIVAALSDPGDLFIARGGELVSFRMKDLINQTDDYLRQQRRVKKRT